MAYLDRMVGMFDSGEIEEALRWAIPLGGTGGESLQPGWFLPSPRNSLEVSRARGGGNALGLTTEAFSALKLKYRAAIVRLIAVGKIELAAFALAELLGETEEALLLLESHKLWALAAEIAERKSAVPGRIVRLWFLAGDFARAVNFARLRFPDFAA